MMSTLKGWDIKMGNKSTDNREFVVMYNGGREDGALFKYVRGHDLSDALANFEAWAKGSSEHMWREWDVRWIAPLHYAAGATRGTRVHKVVPPTRTWRIG